MFVLHCTKKLLGRLPPCSGVEADERGSDTTLGDWTAHLFFIGRQQTVLGVNNKTLLPVLLPIAPNKTFGPRFVEAVGGRPHGARHRPNGSLVGDVQHGGVHPRAH